MFEGSEMCFEDSKTCLKGAKCVLEWSEICILERNMQVKSHSERNMQNFFKRNMLEEFKRNVQFPVKRNISSKIYRSVSQAKYVEMCQAKHDTYSAYVRRIVVDFSHAPPNEYSPSPNDKKQEYLVWDVGLGGKLIQKLCQKEVYEESFSRHTTMVPEQVKTMKIQAGIQVSRPGELKRQLQLWKDQRCG
ncbi:hypothetical protein Tco_1407713 [Tanacetum coccineum]